MPPGHTAGQSSVDALDGIRRAQEGTTITATLNTASRREILTMRLDVLRGERDRALAETIPSGAGDVADRATNVDGHVRLAMLDERIATVESELAASQRPAERSDTGRVA